MNTPTVTVVVPAWKSEFLAETLTSLQEQSFPDFKAMIIVDGDDDETVSRCGPFLSDPRFLVQVQKKRLGWVRNTNSGLAMSLSPYTMILPHDDVLKADYLSALLQILEGSPEPACAFSDIEKFGDEKGVLSQNSISGSPFLRQMTLLLEHLSAVAFRGLFRTGILKKTGGIPTTMYKEFAADTLWMSRMARIGSLQRVPSALYRKRYHIKNTHSHWQNWSKDEMLEAWLVFCREALNEALLINTGEWGRLLLLLASLNRLVFRSGRIPPFKVLMALSEDEKNSLLEKFTATARTHPSLSSIFTGPLMGLLTEVLRRPNHPPGSPSNPTQT